MGRVHLLLWPGALVALCAGCGSAATPPSTGVTATRPAPDTVAGQVVSNRAGTVTLASSAGVDSRFTSTSGTPVTRIVSAAAADLAPGTCLVAGGGSAGGAVTAAWVLLEGPAGCTRPGAGLVRAPAGLAVVAGMVQAVTAHSVAVHGPDGGELFAITSATPVGRVLDATVADVSEGRCVTARGRRDGSGQLRARHVTVVPAPAGGCFTGSDGVGALSLLEPRAGAGGPARQEDATAGGGVVGPAGVSAGGGAVTSPPPITVEPEGTGAGSGASSPQRAGGSTPPEFVPPPQPPPQAMPTEPASTPLPRPGERTPARSAPPGMSGRPGTSGSPAPR